MLQQKVILLIITLIAITSCAHPPTDELEEARLAIKEAYKRGAHTWASKEYESAQEAYEKANQYILEQDYEKARKHAKNAAELAYLARRITEEREKEAREGTEEAVALREDEQSKAPTSATGIEEGALSEEAEGILARPECKDIKIIYFDFDQYTLRPDAIRGVEANLACLRTGEFNVSLEGHCDERGSNEYNLALGKRRSESVKDYLIELGIKPTRIETVSFGEERPAVLGKGEDAWTKNRRVEFVFK